MTSITKYSTEQSRMIGNINNSIESIKTYLHWLDVNVIMSLEVQVEHHRIEIQRINDIMEEMARAVDESLGKDTDTVTADFLVDVFIRRNRLR